jgi:hypothetical protein
MKNSVLTCLLLALFGCKKEEIRPSFSGPAFPFLDSLASMPFYQSLPIEEKLKLSEAWYFDGMDKNPGIMAFFPDSADSLLIDLPHRHSEPNSNLWYSTEISLPEGYLWVGADDGAQVWLDGKPVLPNEALFFPLPKSNQSPLQIRVINNAATGGLRQVYWVRKQAWEENKQKHDDVFSNLLAKTKDQLWIEDSGIDRDSPIWISEPTVLAQGADSLRIVWVAEKNQQATLHYGHDPNMILQSSPVVSTEGIYSVTVPARKCVYYFFELGNSTSPVYSLKTPTADSGKTSFVVWADSQSSWEVFRKTLLEIEKTQPDFSIGIGDLVSNAGNQWEYVRLLQSLHSLKVPHYLFPGNHDYDHAYRGKSNTHWQAENFRKYLRNTGEPNYQTWTNGPCAFIALDPNENFPVGIPSGSAQMEWLEATIESDAWKQAPWKIILVHQPPFSQGWPGYQGEKTIENLLKPYSEKGLIDVVISGHTHDYERLLLSHRAGKTAFLILGGAGGNLESTNTLESVPNMDKVIRTHHFGKIDADKNRLIFRAIDLEGKVIDSLQLTK